MLKSAARRFINRSGLIAPNRILLAVALVSATLVIPFIAPTRAGAVGGYIATDSIGQHPQNAMGLNTDFTQGQTGFEGTQQASYDSTSNTLFVSDYNGNRILAYSVNPSTHQPDLYPYAALGQQSLSSRVPGASATAMAAPTATVLDSVHRRLFVGEWNSGRILVFDLTGGISTGMAASYVLGKSDFVTYGAGSGQNGMTNPQGLAYSPSTRMLYSADWALNRVLVFDTTSLSNGMNASYVLGQSDFSANSTTTNASTFKEPSGVALDDATNRLFVTEWGNNRVTVFDVSTIANGEAAVNVLGQPDFTSTVDDSNAKGFNNPHGGTVDSARNRLFVNDYQNNRILAFDITSISNNQDAQFVIGQSNFTANGSGLSQTALNRPSSALYDSTNDRLWIGDEGNYRVLSFAGNVSTNGPAAVSVTGQIDTTGAPGYSLNAPTGQNVTSWGLSRPGSVAVDETNHRLYVADVDNNRILVHQLDVNNHLIDRFPEYVIGQSNFTTGTSSRTASTLHTPVSVSYNTNRLFVTDTDNNRVLMFDTSSLSNGMSATRVLGQPDMTSGTTGLANNRMNYPTGLAVDNSGNRLFVSDSYNNRVLVFNISTVSNGQAAVNVLGQSDFTTKAATTTSTGMSGPRDIAYDSASNRLYVSEHDNNRVKVYDVASITDNEAAPVILGQPDASTSSAGTTAAKLRKPSAIAIDSAGQRIFVSDRDNNRVVVFNTSSLSTGQSAVRVFGQPNMTSMTASSDRDGLKQPSGLAFVASSNQLIVPQRGANRVGIFEVDTQVTTAALPNGSNIATYSQQLTASNPNGTTSWSVTSGAMPTGLSLSSSGVISGTPAAAPGIYNFTTQASTSPSGHGTLVGSKSLSITIVNSAPSSPTNLKQTRSNGVAIATGGWTNENSVSIAATTFDPDIGDQNRLCVETKPLGTAFANTEDGCGPLVSAGTEAWHNSGTQSNGQFHWQVRTQDATGAYSPWVSFGGNAESSRDFGIDTAAPSAPTVRDGATQGTDVALNNGSLDTLSGNWSGSVDALSGISSYEYSIGTSPGTTDVRSWTSVAGTEVTATGLTLRTAQSYYFNVRAVDMAGNASAAGSSNGQLVAPSLSFGVSSSSVSFDPMKSANSFAPPPRSVTATTSTNAYGGYVITQYAEGLMSSAASNLSMYSGTYNTPTAWSGTGFGYTSSDTSIQSYGNKFNNGNLYAGLATTAPGHVVADNTTGAVTSAISNESFVLTYRSAASPTQAAGTYSTRIRLTASALF